MAYAATPASVASVAPVALPVAAITNATPPEETAKALRRGLQLLAQGQITEARQLAQSQITETRQLLQRWGLENATAALALGMSYDPIELEQLRSFGSAPMGDAVKYAPVTASPSVVPDSFADIAKARTWYQKAKDLGSIEAERRLERLSRREDPAR
jgi:hypothetical protein